MDITPAIIADFRADFAGFASKATWPDEKVSRALARADKETGSNRWGGYSDFSIKQLGLFNYAAHLLSVSAGNDKATLAGGIPRAAAQVQSKSVADESVTYAVSNSASSSEDDALKATAYGQEFYRLRRRVAAGGSGSMAGASGVIYA